MDSSYLTGKPEELFEQAPAEIKELIIGDAVTNVTAILGKSYKIPVSSYVAFENIISYILIGAILPENAVKAIIEILRFDEDTAYKLASDLDKTILEKARISILGKSPKDMVTLSFQEGRTPDELRKEILDTTKRGPILPPEEPAKTPMQATKDALAAATTPEEPSSSPAAQSKSPVMAGSRSALMEQLKMLDTIPDDEEIAERIRKIQEQISGSNKENERGLESTVALQEFMPKNEEVEAVAPEIQAATYSKAPTKYNVDPYREVSEE